MVAGFFDGPIPTECHKNLIKFQHFEVQTGPNYATLWSTVSKHHQQMIGECIATMENECKHYITFTQRYGSTVDMLTKTISRITTRKLARLILNCTDTIRAKKNWNSHDATFGSTICELSSIISSLSNASVSELDSNFIQLNPHGVVHTGAKYGNYDVCYTEYMASTVKS